MGGGYYFPPGSYAQFPQYGVENESLGTVELHQSPRNRTNSMPDAPPLHDGFLKRSGFGRVYDNSEDMHGSIAGNEESIGASRYNYELNSSRFRSGNGRNEGGEQHIVAKE